MSRLRCICMLLGLNLALAGTAFAAPVAHPSKPASKPPSGIKVSTLGGKFAFVLPAGYVAETMPPGDAGRGTAGAHGTMYVSQKSKRVVIATQVPTPPGVNAKDNDDVFLARVAKDFVDQQRQAMPGFKPTATRKMVIRKLGVSRVDSSGTQGGGPTLGTTFIAGSGKTLSVVQIISRADDPKGHDTLVRQVLAGQ
jgi:hypothetical protein